MYIQLITIMQFDEWYPQYYPKQLNTKDKIMTASEWNEFIKELDIKHNKEWVSMNCITMLDDL